MKELFNLLEMRPLASIIILGAIALVVIVLFREIIRRYLIKKFELYTEDELKDFALRYAHGYFIDITTRKKLDIEDAYQKYLKEKR